MAGVNTFSAIVIFISLIYFIHKIRTDNAKYSVNKWSVSFQILMSVFGFIACLAYGLFRPNLIIQNHNSFTCFIIYCSSLFPWAIGRYFTLLSFLFRIWIAFRGSALAYPRWIILLFGSVLTIGSIGTIIVLALTAVPVAVKINNNLTVCMSFSQETVGIDPVESLKKFVQALDFILVIIFLFMFIKKLHNLRGLNKDEGSHKFKRTKSRDTTHSTHSTHTETSGISSKDRAIINALPSASPEPTSPNEELKKRVSIGQRFAIKKDYGTARKLDNLEKLMMKQTFLVVTVVVTTWITFGGSIFDPKLSLFYGFDAMCNTVCSFLVFKYFNKFWNGCLTCCRCYCCYSCCMHFCGCFPCDGQDGCCACCICCDGLMQRTGTFVRRMSSRHSVDNIETNINQQNEMELTTPNDHDDMLRQNTYANAGNNLTETIKEDEINEEEEVP
eukprot:191901_1